MKERIKINYLLASLYCILSFFSNAQNLNIDSLENELSTSNTPAQKATVLKSIFYEIQYINPDKALEVAIEFQSLIKETGQNKGRPKLEALNMLGLAFLNLNQSDSALFYFQEGLEQSKLQGDSLFISKGYNNIGVVNSSLENYRSCVYYFNKSADIDKRIGDLNGSVISLMNIGSIYMYLHVYDSARYFLTTALTGAIELQDQNLIATGYLNVGTVEHRTNNYDEAKLNYFKAIEIAETFGANEIISMAYRDLARIFQDKKTFKIAIEYDLKSLEFANKGGILDLAKSALQGLAISYENLGLYKEAYENQKQYTFLLDSIAELENSQAFIEMQEKYNSEQTAIENEMLLQKDKINSLEKEKNKEELANSKIIIVSSVLGIVLLVILAFTLYNRNLLKQKANLKLHNANEIINEKNKDIIASIEYASKIQEALLPTKDNQKLFKDSFYLLQPKDIVSGDFYWYSEVGEKKIIAVVDCTGHGVPGAFMSMIGNTFLHEIVNEKRIIEPNQILNILRRRVVRAMNQDGDGTNRKDGMDMAICVIDETKMTLDFAGANNPLYLISSNEINEFKGDKQPVGYFGDREVPFKRQALTIAKGDCIYIFSDGYADQFGGPKGKKFKYKQMRDLIFANYSRPMQEQKKILVDAFELWKGSLEQVDDVCMVGIRI